MGAEKIIEHNIRKQLKEMGYATYKIHVGQYGPEGFPDLVVIKGGVTSYFEVKAQGEIPTPIQLFRMRELRAVGCIASAVWSFKDVTKHLARKREINGRS